MTFQPGDKVRFLNDVGGGTITRVVKQIAYVETPDGFEIPAPIQELVKIEQGFFAGEDEAPVKQKRPNSPKPVFGSEPKKQEYYETEPENLNPFETDITDEPDDTITSENSTLNIILGIVPVKEKGKNEPLFRVYLISDCSYHMLYTLSVVKENFCYGNRSGIVEDDTKLLINTFSLADLRELQSFKINCIFFKKGIYLPHEPLVYEYKIDSFMLADPQNWTENDYFDEKAVIINLTEESLIYEIERMVSENEERYIIQKKRKEAKPRPVKTESTSDMEEVDLHIEHLTDNYLELSAGEIIDMQLSRFNIALEGAIRHNIKRIVFIHGVGNGKLKYEIRKTLDFKYANLRYQDASFKEYGYGATMVLLKK